MKVPQKTTATVPPLPQVHHGGSTLLTTAGSGRPLPATLLPPPIPPLSTSHLPAPPAAHSGSLQDAAGKTSSFAAALRNLAKQAGDAPGR